MASLKFVRLARKDKDGATGFLYFHSWGTGNQELVFKSPTDAQRWADTETYQGRRPTSVDHPDSNQFPGAPR